MTGLTLAVACGHADLASKFILIDNNSPLNDSDCLVNLGDVNGRRPLHWAASVGGYACAKHIIDLSTRLYMRAKDDKGDTALHNACSEGDDGMVALLLEGRKKSTQPVLLHLVRDINKEGETAAMLARRMGHDSCSMLAVDRESALAEVWGVSCAPLLRVDSGFAPPAQPPRASSHPVPPPLVPQSEKAQQVGSPDAAMPMSLGLSSMYPTDSGLESQEVGYDHSATETSLDSARGKQKRRQKRKTSSDKQLAVDQRKQRRRDDWHRKKKERTNVVAAMEEDVENMKQENDSMALQITELKRQKAQLQAMLNGGAMAMYTSPVNSPASLLVPMKSDYGSSAPVSPMSNAFSPTTEMETLPDILTESRVPSQQLQMHLLTDKVPEFADRLWDSTLQEPGMMISNV